MLLSLISTIALSPAFAGDLSVTEDLDESSPTLSVRLSGDAPLLGATISGAAAVGNGAQAWKESLGGGSLEDYRERYKGLEEAHKAKQLKQFALITDRGSLPDEVDDLADDVEGVEVQGYEEQGASAVYDHEGLTVVYRDGTSDNVDVTIVLTETKKGTRMKARVDYADGSTGPLKDGVGGVEAVRLTFDDGTSCDLELRAARGTFVYDLSDLDVADGDSVAASWEVSDELGAITSGEDKTTAEIEQAVLSRLRVTVDEDGQSRISLKVKTSRDLEFTDADVSLSIGDKKANGSDSTIDVEVWMKSVVPFDDDSTCPTDNPDDDGAGGYGDCQTPDDGVYYATLTPLNDDGKEVGGSAIFAMENGWGDDCDGCDVGWDELGWLADGRVRSGWRDTANNGALGKLQIQTPDQNVSAVRVDIETKAGPALAESSFTTEGSVNVHRDRSAFDKDQDVAGLYEALAAGESGTIEITLGGYDLSGEKATPIASRMGFDLSEVEMLLVIGDDTTAGYGDILINGEPIDIE